MRSLFCFVGERKNELLAAGPPAAASRVRRGIKDQCHRPRQAKRTLEKNSEFFSIAGAPGAGPILCWEGAVAGVSLGAPPQWCGGCRAQRQGTTCPGRGKGGAARPKTPPSVSLAQMAFWARRAPPQECPKVAPGQGPLHGPILTQGDTNSPSLDHYTYWGEDAA